MARLLADVSARTPGYRKNARAFADTLEQLGQERRREEARFIHKLLYSELGQKGAGPAEDTVNAEFIRDYAHGRLNGEEGPAIEGAKLIRKLFHNKIGRDLTPGEAGTGGWVGYKGKWISF